MKFTINQSTLLKALVLTGKAISTKPVIPILGDYLFKTEGNLLQITGGSEGFFVSKTIEVNSDLVVKPIAIPSAKLLSIIKRIPDQPIEFIIKEKKEGKATLTVLTIKSSTGNYNVPVENGEDYPQMPSTELISFDADLTPLLSSLNKTLFACSPDDSKPALMGINLSFSDNKALLVGCNGGLISIASLPVEFSTDKSFIIPPKILSVLQQVGSGDKINIVIGENNIHFTDSSGLHLKSLMIDEKYVDYESVIPQNNDKHVVVNKQQMIGAISRVSLFSEIGNDVIKISFSEGKCTLAAKNSFGEHATEDFTIQYEGEPIEFGASGKQFTSCLNCMDKEESNIFLLNPNRAILLTDDPATIPFKRDLIIVMPYRLPF